MSGPMRRERVWLVEVALLGVLGALVVIGRLLEGHSLLEAVAGLGFLVAVLAIAWLWGQAQQQGSGEKTELARGVWWDVLVFAAVVAMVAAVWWWTAG